MSCSRGSARGSCVSSGPPSEVPRVGGGRRQAKRARVACAGSVACVAACISSNRLAAPRLRTARRGTPTQAKSLSCLAGWVAPPPSCAVRTECSICKTWDGWPDVALHHRGERALVGRREGVVESVLA
jgi:hypothetical protein